MPAARPAGASRPDGPGKESARSTGRPEPGPEGNPMQLKPRGPSIRWAALFPRVRDVRQACRGRKSRPLTEDREKPAEMRPPHPHTESRTLHKASAVRTLFSCFEEWPH